MKLAEKIYLGLTILLSIGLLAIVLLHFYLYKTDASNSQRHYYILCQNLMFFLLISIPTAINLWQRRLVFLPTLILCIFLLVSLYGIPIGIFGLILLHHRAKETRLTELPVQEDSSLTEEAQLLNQGKAAYERGDHEQCRNICQQLYKKNPTDARNLCAWGQSLSNLAFKESGDDADTLFAEANSKYEQALKLLPNYTEGWQGWGQLLTRQAQMKSGPAAETLFQQAHQKYEQALKLQPSNAECWYAWGWSLHRQASQAKGQAAEALTKQAADKYQQILNLRPDAAMAWDAWGCLLAQQARRLTGPAAETLLHEADDKFLKAVSYRPDYARAWYNWSRLAGNLAEFRTGAERMAILAQSEERLRHANNLRLEPPPKE